MTVKQLIEKLGEYDPEMPVMSNGYEGGLNDIDSFEKRDVVLNYHEAWYYGKHESVDGIHGEGDALKNTTVKALIIG